MAQFQLGVDGLAAHLSRGRVTKVHADKFTASVYIHAGNFVGTEPACRIFSPGLDETSKTGIIYLPQEDDIVYLDWSFGAPPYIVGHHVDVKTEEKVKGYKTQILPLRGFGGEDNFHRTGNASYRWGPTDLMPGDKVVMGKLGNYLGILAGGLSVLRAGPLSQIIASKIGDFVKVVARNFEVFSDFGVMRFRNDEGSNLFEIFGNDTDIKSNSHLESDWDYTLRMGGENLFELRLLRGLFKFLVDRDGRMQVRARGAHITLDEPPVINMRGNSVSSVEGHRSNTVDGDDWKQVKGTKTEKVGRQVFLCAGPSTEVITGNKSESYLGTLKTSIRGTSLTSLTPEAKEEIIAAGSYKISIGNPLNLGIPAPILAAQAKMGDYELEVFSGDIDLSVTVKGDIGLSTKLGDVSGKTLAGDVTLSTALGNLDFSTLAGDVDLSTLAGDISASTLAGKVSLSTAVGNVEIEALTGSIKMTAGLTSVELGPAGIKINNGSEELLSLLGDVIQALIAAQTPGYGAPLTNVASFIAMVPRLAILKGV